jgi:hypothetical protein
MDVVLELDGKPLKTFSVDTAPDKQRGFDVRVPVGLGSRVLRARFADPSYVAKDPPGARNRVMQIDYLEVRGPHFEPAGAPVPEQHRRIISCGHAPGSAHEPTCARKVVRDVARRAWRRPVAPAEVERLAALIDTAQRDGDSFEQGVRLAVQAVLVSPNFLFRIERNPPANATRKLGEFELASRLSYFLWSSMPDERMFQLAEAGRLSQPATLRAEVRRMLLDARSSALIDNFAGQWLQTRNLDSFQPDPDRFPEFNEALRDAMREETRLFFDAMLREDRPVNEFLDARYTFLNEPLARHYGVPGVTGQEFRRVALPADSPRGGLLGQAGVLAVSSYPTRTSPVIRGKWILENILGAPPPPPPPNVPSLDEQKIGEAASLRQRLEQHRANPVCASCHARMDPLGFSLENFDALGRWRTRDGQFPIDPAGVLPNGAKIAGPADLRRLLAADRDAFTRALAEKLLTYALGRGLEFRDRRFVKEIAANVSARGYRFSELFQQVAASLPFRMKKGQS